MDIAASPDVSNQPTAKSLGLVAISALAYVLCDLLHELGHAAATLLPLGVEAVSISTIGLSSAGSSAVVAIAGPLVNFALALALFLVFVPRLSPTWRYFAWLSGTANLFNATAYLLYSSVLGTGDWATALNAVAAPTLWRPVAGLAGVVLYIASILASLVALRRLVSSGVVAASHVDRYCTTAYWTGGLVITAGAVFNPVSPWFILTSGVATGFGAMLGLLALPTLLRRAPPINRPIGESLRIGWPWVIAGAAATVIFIGIFGPGIRLTA
jgi:hypothetical protein